MKQKIYLTTCEDAFDEGVETAGDTTLLENPFECFFI